MSCAAAPFSLAWRRLPLLPAALAFAAGIFAGTRLLPTWWMAALGVAVGALAAVLMRCGAPLALALALVALPLGLGAGVRLARHEHQAAAVAAALDRSALVTVEGRLRDYLAVSGDTRRAQIEVATLSQNGRTFRFRVPLALIVGGDWPLRPEALPGRRVRFRGRLTVGPRYRNFSQRPPPSPRYAVYLKSAGLLAAEAPPPGNPLDLLRRANEATNRRLDRLDAATGWRHTASLGVVKALVLGRRGEIEETWEEIYRRGGIYHVLAISGSHVVLLTYLLFAGLGLAGVPRRLLYALSIAALCGFVAFVGWTPSVARAAVMGLLLLAARASGRQGSAWNAWGAAALVLLAMRPADLFDLGFQLTFLATGAMLAWMPPLTRALAVLPRWAAVPLAMTAAAQLGTTPLLLLAFNTAPAAALVANALVLPLVAAVLVGGVFLALSAWIPGPLAEWLAAAIDVANHGVVAATEALAGLAPQLVVPAPAPGWVALFLGALLVVWQLPRGSRVPLFAALTVAGVLVHLPPAPAPLAGARLTMLDVGQGDALLLQWGTHAILVDGGGGFSEHFHVGRSVVFPALADAGVRRLDAVVLSHPHRDHGSGLGDLFGLLPIGELWTSDHFERNGVLARVEARAAAAGTRRRALAVGERLRLGALAADVLHPSALSSYRADAVNNSSLCLRVAVAGERILLAGDLQEPAEREIAASGVPLAAGLLKVPHHGSRTSTTPAFLRAVRPRLGLASMGADNPFGHPAAATLEHLRHARVRLWRTDRMGAIRVDIRAGRMWPQSRVGVAAPAPPGS